MKMTFSPVRALIALLLFYNTDAGELLNFFCSVFPLFYSLHASSLSLEAKKEPAVDARSPDRNQLRAFS